MARCIADDEEKGERERERAEIQIVFLNKNFGKGFAHGYINKPKYGVASQLNWPLTVLQKKNPMRPFSP